MKNVCFLLSVLSFTFVFSQSKIERKKITDSYNLFETQNLINYLVSFENDKIEKIESFFRGNTDVKFLRKFFNENVLYEVYDIIDGKPVYIATDNVNSGRAIKVNHLYPSGSLGLSLLGNGMTVGVWDGGWVLGTHNEFVTAGISKVVHPDSPNSNPTADFHGTHVAGTVAAKGVTTSARGMAPGANLLSYNWSSDQTEVVIEAYSNALLISNHSYGVPVLNNDGDLNVPSWYMGCYNTTAQQWDQIAYDYPYYLPVMSAGNSGMSNYSGGLASGYDKLTGNKNAKNLLIVANANPSVNAITGNLTSLSINSSSSQGPTDDGRIKPDIAADGTNVLSTSNSGVSSYDTASGTSMASPSVAGALILLQEHYFNLNSNYMLSSTLRGLVCHTAFDDSVRIGPDPVFGWGLLDARESALVISNSKLAVPTVILEEKVLSQSQTYNIQVTVNSPKLLKASISWNDLPGTDMSGSLNSSVPVLVNDLDLRIIKDTEISYPWKLDLSDVSAPAIKGDNIVDNIEKVEVENALGTYTIQVSHKGALTGVNQVYSLIVSGFDEVVLSNSSVVKNEFFIYPNPANDLLNIESPNSPINKYEIYDMQGRLVANTATTEVNSLQVDLQSYNTGVYIIKLFSESGTTIKKFTKK